MDHDEFAVATLDVYARLIRVVFLVCGDPALAEECAPEAMVRVWERGDDVAPGAVPAWATTVALNCCRAHFRRRGAEARALRRVLARPAPVENATIALSEDVRRAVLALPFRQREVVVLHYLLDQDITTIAATIGISAGAVKNALFNARSRLASSLGAEAGPQTLSSAWEQA